MGIDGILQEGFVTTTADQLINYVRTGSMWPMSFGLACCAIEMIHAGCSRYDLDRFGIVFRNNKQINRKLSAEALKLFMKELITAGNAKWLTKDEKTVRIVWRTNEQWGNLIYNYISEKSMFNLVCSIYELREQDTVEDQEFYMLDLTVFMAALAALQKRGLCQVFEGSIEGSTSVKFFSG